MAMSESREAKTIAGINAFISIFERVCELILTLAIVQLASIATLTAYLSYEYVWPYFKRRFFPNPEIHRRLQVKGLPMQK